MSYLALTSPRGIIPRPNKQRNPVDGPINVHFQGGMWRIFNVDEFVMPMQSFAKYYDAMELCDAMNFELHQKS